MTNATMETYLRNHKFNRDHDIRVIKTDFGYTISIDVNELPDEYELREIYEKLTGKEFRVCSVCGQMMSDGYMDEGGFYACSDKCFKQHFNEMYGEGKWKAVDDMTEKDWENTWHFDEDAFYAYLDENGIWQPEYTFWTQWY